MVKIVGVHKVICVCGEPMIRTGGIFGEFCLETYACKTCNKAVNVIELSDDEAKRMVDSIQ